MYSFVAARTGTWVWRVPCRKFKSCANRILGLDELHTFWHGEEIQRVWELELRDSCFSLFFPFWIGLQFSNFWSCGNFWRKNWKHVGSHQSEVIGCGWSWLEGGTHQMFPICLQLAAGKTWQSLIYTVYTVYIHMDLYIYTHIIQIQLSSLVCCRYIYIIHISLFSILTNWYAHAHTCHSIGVGSMTSILGEDLLVETRGNRGGLRNQQLLKEAESQSSLAEVIGEVLGHSISLDDLICWGPCGVWRFPEFSGSIWVS